MKNLLDRELIPDKYREVLSDNIDTVSKAVERNPREVKRFLNNFIVAYEIYEKDTRIDRVVLLILQALNVRWNSFYRLIMNSTKEIRETIKKYSELTGNERLRIYEPSQQQEPDDRLKFDEQSKILLSEFKLDDELWNFIKENSTAILEVEDLDIYRRAGVIEEDFFRAGRNLDDLYNEGKSYVESGRYREAIKIFDRCLHLDPDNIRVKNKKAYSLAHINEFDEAKRIIEELLGTSPWYATAVDTKGFILLKQGKYDEALKVLKEAYDMNPSYFGTSEHLAEVYGKKTDEANARKYRDRAAELRKSRFFIY